MSGVSTHVLDTSMGRPAAGVPVVLERIAVDGSASTVGQSITDTEGRVRGLLPEGLKLSAGTYRLTFDTAVYFASRRMDCFYPSIAVLFTVTDAAQHYHVPLLLSPFGYSTYRGT